MSTTVDTTTAKPVKKSVALSGVAAGTTALRKRSRLSHIRSDGIGASSCGIVAAVTSARRKPLVRAPPRVTASKAARTTIASALTCGMKL